MLAQVKPGDLVLLEFAPAALSPADKASATRTLQGIGDGTFDYLDPGTQKIELVHSYGWYLRRMVVDTINHGASPILCSPPAAAQTSAITPTAAEPTAADWTRAIATEQRIPFVDLTAGGGELTPPTLRAGLEALQPDPLAPYLKRTKP
jgi:rhamnogalacturonan acetylesterase